MGPVDELRVWQDGCRFLEMVTAFGERRRRDGEPSDEEARGRRHFSLLMTYELPFLSIYSAAGELVHHRPGFTDDQGASLDRAVKSASQKRRAEPR
jgi:hypothetical protein